jgi:hypothetical protein
MDSPSDGFFGARYGQRVYVAKVGPWGLFMFAAFALLIAAAAVVFLIGAILIWVPVIAVLVLAAFLYGRWRRLRGN